MRYVLQSNRFSSDDIQWNLIKYYRHGSKTKYFIKRYIHEPGTFEVICGQLRSYTYGPTGKIKYCFPDIDNWVDIDLLNFTYKPTSSEVKFAIFKQYNRV